MATLTQEQAAKVWRDWLGAFQASGRVSVAEAKTHFTDQYVEFHSIWPALLKGRNLFLAFDGMRYDEPEHFTKAAPLPGFVVKDEIIRAYGDSLILVTSAGQGAKLERSGAISFHINRQTWVLVKVDGKWLLTAGHNSPPGSELGPYGHNQFAAGAPQYAQ